MNMKHARSMSRPLLKMTLGVIAGMATLGCGGAPEPEPIVEVTPIAHASSVSVKEGRDVEVTLTGEAGPEASLVFKVVEHPAHGSLSGTAPALTYTPDANFLGRDSFTFTVSDGGRTSTAARIDVEVLNAPYYTFTRGSESHESALYFTNERGEVRLIGNTGHALVGIKVDPTDGVIYATTRSDDFNYHCNNCLVTLDAETGAATVVGTFSVQTAHSALPGLAFTSDGSLYGVTRQRVYKIDKTSGAAAHVGPTNVDLTGFGMWVDAEDTLWLLNSDSTVYTLDVTDGSVTLVHEGEVLMESAGVSNTSNVALRGDRNPDTNVYWGVTPNWTGSSAGVSRLDIDGETAAYIDVARVESVVGVHNLAFVR